MKKKEFNEMDFEAAEKRSIERKDSFPTVEAFKRGMSVVPLDKNRNPEKNIENLYDRIADGYVDYCKGIAWQSLAQEYMRRAFTEDIEWKNLIEQYLQDFNYIGEQYRQLKKEVGPIDWANARH